MDLSFMLQIAAAILTEPNVKMMQNVIKVLDLEEDIENTTHTGTLRALSLVFSEVHPPPELEAKLNALLKKLEKLNPMPTLKDSE